MSFQQGGSRCWWAVAFHVFAIVLSLVIGTAWDGERSLEAREQPAATATNSNNSAAGKDADQPAAKAAAEEDLSLTLEEYQKLGVPAVDKSWTGSDMAAAAQVLKRLAARDERQLPRSQSERSAALFARMTSAKDLQPLSDRQVPLNERLGSTLTYMDGTNQILLIYLRGFQTQKVRDTEVLELMAHIFRLSVAVQDRADELLPTLDKNDPKYPARMQGFNQMKQGLATTVSGGLTTVTERQHYRTEELRRFTKVLQETLPKIVPRLLPEAQTETIKKLEKMQRDRALQDLKPDLSELVTKVNDSVKKSDP
ncbi:MAG: hypothetical protein ACKOBW_13020 [Planctomycetota bacterium]